MVYLGQTCYYQFNLKHLCPPVEQPCRPGPGQWKNALCVVGRLRAGAETLMENSEGTGRPKPYRASSITPGVRKCAIPALLWSGSLDYIPLLDLICSRNISEHLRLCQGLPSICDTVPSIPQSPVPGRANGKVNGVV